MISHVDFPGVMKAKNGCQWHPFYSVVVESAVDCVLDVSVD